MKRLSASEPALVPDVTVLRRSFLRTVRCTNDDRRRDGRPRQRALSLVGVCVWLVQTGCGSTRQVVRDEAPPEATTVVDTVQEAFDALQLRDIEALERIFDADAQLLVVGSDGLRMSTRDGFIEGLRQNSRELVERMWRPEVEIDGDLATLRAPYDFHIDGKLSHCGVDVVQLVRSRGQWRIVSIAYTKQTQGCEPPDAPIVPSRIASNVALRVGEGAPAPADRTEKALVPSNVILMVGDGMGFAALRALRDLRDDPRTPMVEATVLDEHLVGIVATDPAGAPGAITDSAAAATAMATGVVTSSGYVGVDPNGLALGSVLQRAVELGKQTGVVVTSTVTHATPAAFLAHQRDRNQERHIADQYLDRRINGQPLANIVLGGGRSMFQRPDRDLVAEFRQAGYEVVTTDAELRRVSTSRVLGLFADEGLAPAASRPDQQPSLVEMTRVALTRLQPAPAGFFLLVEGSQIDWRAHENDVLGMVAELDEFARTVELVLEFAAQRSDTLVLITADHETGGFATGADDALRWYPARAASVRVAAVDIRSRILAGEDPGHVMQDAVGMRLSGSEVDALRRAARQRTVAGEQELLHRITAAIDRYVGVGWTTRDHTATDVPLMGDGPGIEQFRGFHRNVDVGRTLLEFWPPPQ